MADVDTDKLKRMGAFDHVRRLVEIHNHLTATESVPGFAFRGRNGCARHRSMAVITAYILEFAQP